MEFYICASLLCLFTAVIWAFMEKISRQLGEIKTLVNNNPGKKPLSAHRKRYLKRWKKNRKKELKKNEPR